MKKLLLLALTTVLLTGCLPATKKLEKQYGYTIEPGNELIDAGMIYTKEKTADGQFRYRTFYNETRQVTLEQYFQDENFTIAHGPSRSWSDDGQVWKEGNYKDGKRHGQWTENSVNATRTGDISKGMYKNDLKEGWWNTTDANGRPKWADYYQEGAFIQRKQSGTDDAPEILPATSQNMPSYACNPALGITNDSICGELSLQHYLATTIQYPTMALENNIMGTAHTSFVIDKEGNITDLYIINGICDPIKKEVIRVINGMKKWSPGEANGKPVKVRFALPIRFRLE